MAIERKQSRERIVPNLIVQKGDTPQENFSVAYLFLKQLNEAYPDLNYPNAESMQAFNPDRTHRTITTYAARADDKVVGILCGEEVSGEQEYRNEPVILRGQVLLVGPKFTNTNVSRELVQRAGVDYSTIILSPVPLGGKEFYGDEKFDKKRRDARQNALRRYYYKFGFEDNPGDSRMIWQRPTSDI